MKVQISKDINYFEVDPTFRMRIGAMFRMMQEVAVLHSSRAGYNTRAMRENGTAWVLHRLAIRIARFPMFGETGEFRTWSKGIPGLKALREFDIHVGAERVAAATSQWFYIDVNAKRIRRIPPEIGPAYGLYPEDSALDVDFEAWPKPVAWVADADIAITPRASDFDSSGHVNNAVYMDYLETLLWRRAAEAGPVAYLEIQFNREIDPRTEAVHACLRREPDGMRFLLTAGTDIFCHGRIEHNKNPGA